MLNNLADFSRTLFCAKFAFFAESCRAETHHPDSGGVGGKGSRAICFTLCFKGLAQQHQFQSYSTKSMRSHGIMRHSDLHYYLTDILIFLEITELVKKEKSATK